MRYIFSGGECTRFTESSHRNLFYWEKIRKFSIFRLFSEAKTEEHDICFLHNFRTFLPCSDTYFLGVSARVFCTQYFCGYW